MGSGSDLPRDCSERLVRLDIALRCFDSLELLYEDEASMRKDWAFVPTAKAEEPHEAVASACGPFG